MGGSGGYRRLTGGSDDFSLQTHRHFIIIYISSNLLKTALEVFFAFIIKVVVIINIMAIICYHHHSTYLDPALKVDIFALLYRSRRDGGTQLQGHLEFFLKIIIILMSDTAMMPRMIIMMMMIMMIEIEEVNIKVN